jgi:hypothetical protein
LSAFSVVYYSNGKISAALQRYCLENLGRRVESAGGELLCVTWEPLFAGSPANQNIVWTGREDTHRNMYGQILAGLEAARNPIVLLAEHDVLYPAAYHDEMAEAASGGVCYNLNVLGLNVRGYFRPNRYHLLSNCAAPRNRLVERIEDKLEEIRRSGMVAWAEPPGDVEISTSAPTIDIRHGRNFTGGREAPDGTYFQDAEYWGSAAACIELFR